jgi:hypothetical protein
LRLIASDLAYPDCLAALTTWLELSVCHAASEERLPERRLPERRLPERRLPELLFGERREEEPIAKEFLYG